MNFNPWTFLFELLNFLVLAFVLHRLLYRPLREAVERRQQDAMRARQEADRMRKEAESVQEQVKQQQAAQEQERQKLLQKAHEQAEAERKNRLAEAEQIIQTRRKEAEEALDRERKESLRELQKESVNLALDLTRRLLVESADRSLNHQLALRLADSLRNLSALGREQLRREWRQEDGAVLESAEELDNTAVATIQEAAAKLLGQPVTPVVRTRPEMIAGARLRLGSLVWEATLAGPLSNHTPAAAQEKS